MSKLDKLIGKEMFHKDFGRVKILSRVPRSRTKVNVRVVQRAKGWDETSGAYRKVKTVRKNFDKNGKEIGKSIHWKLFSDKYAQRDHEDVVHVDELHEGN